MPGTVAILGATSQLAGDYIRHAAAAGRRQLVLFARDPGRLAAPLRGAGYPILPMSAFGEADHDAVINFVGVGDPARAQALGAGIFAATREWDEKVLAYCDRSPATRYVFLSSGAVYGDGFAEPATSATPASFPVNRLGPANWYGLAKLHAEAGHRARADRSIIDLRIFNFVSRSGDPDARFLISDAVRAIVAGMPLATTRQELTRDYLSPTGLHALIEACVNAPAGTNAPADAYTRAPLGKADLLALLADEFGLRYAYANEVDAPNATGFKPHYFSLDRTAHDWGYRPTMDSAEAVRAEVGAMLERRV